VIDTQTDKEASVEINVTDKQTDEEGESRVEYDRHIRPLRSM
jgi:hypothetical protein